MKYLEYLGIYITAWQFVSSALILVSLADIDLNDGYTGSTAMLQNSKTKSWGPSHCEQTDCLAADVLNSGTTIELDGGEFKEGGDRVGRVMFKEEKELLPTSPFFARRL